MKKGNWINLVVVFAVLILAALILINSNNKPITDKEVVQCIGDQSVLYVQVGCPHCERQEDLFGDNLQYLDVIDCFYERDKCEGITATPTWKINGELYEGYKSLEELQNLTGC